MTHHEKIRQDLLEQISGMRTGERIPNELHLAEFFGVSRMTVNKVITELAKEGFLTRKRGAGSFVSRKNCSRKVITILLPSANNIPFHLQYIISGATEAARELGVGIELIAISPDNTKDHIDFSAIEHLSESSYVLVVSNWFYRVFPFLNERKCKVLLLDRQLLQFAPENENTKKFQILDCNIQAMVHNAFQRLYDAGCRKIAFRGMKPILQSISCHYYELELEQRNMKGLLLANDGGNLRLTEAELDSLTRFKPDGLIFDAQHFRSMMGRDFADVTNIPDGVSYEVIQFNPHHNFLDRNPSSEEIDGMSAGNMAVRMLLDPERPKYKILSPTYHPESSGGDSANHLFFEVI